MRFEHTDGVVRDSPGARNRLHSACPTPSLEKKGFFSRRLFYFQASCGCAQTHSSINTTSYRTYYYVYIHLLVCTTAGKLLIRLTPSAKRSVRMDKLQLVTVSLQQQQHCIVTSQIPFFLSISFTHHPLHKARSFFGTFLVVTKKKILQAGV